MYIYLFHYIQMTLRHTMAESQASIWVKRVECWSLEAKIGMSIYGRLGKMNASWFVYEDL